jgi:hypothetical protein
LRQGANMEPVIKLVQDSLTKIQNWYIVIERKITILAGDVVMISESIERLTALAETITAAVTKEAEEADAKIAARDAAIAELKAANDALAAKLAALEASGGISAAEVQQLKDAVTAVETASGAISKIALADNPTPVSDVVTGSVVTDPAPTPAEVPPVNTTGVTDGAPAAEAVTEAVQEVAAEVQ